MTASTLCRASWCCTLLLTFAAAASGEQFLPTEIGTLWEYDRTEQGGAGPERSTATVRITGMEPLADKEVLKLESATADQLTKTELITAGDDGVLCFRRTMPDGTTVSFDPPQPVIKPPLQAGAKWTFDDKIAGSNVRQEFTVVAEEEVVVPAGTFRAFRLHCEQPWPISVTVTRWFVRGTGFVKDVTTTRGPGGRLLSRVTTLLRKVSVAPPPTPASKPSAEPKVDEASAPAVEAPQPGPSPSPSVSLEVAGEREGAPQTDFRSDAENIFVRWSGRNLPSGSTVRIVWVAEDVGDLAPPNFIVDETASVVTMPELSARFTLSRPMDGWATGKYRVDMYIDGKLVQHVKVAITD